jgi:hypothetical protein
MKKGGLKDENIIVFMYDDIAFNPENPRPGVIINKPNGNDVYQGVPKVNNFYYPVHYFNLASYHFINYDYIIYLTTIHLLLFSSFYCRTIQERMLIRTTSMLFFLATKVPSLVVAARF